MLSSLRIQHATNAVVLRTTRGHYSSSSSNRQCLLSPQEYTIATTTTQRIPTATSRNCRRLASTTSKGETSAEAEALQSRLRQQRAYEYYNNRGSNSGFFSSYRGSRPRANNNNKKKVAATSAEDRNIQLAWYASAVVMGVVGATYASVPLYKVFCQATGFGGTTQRVYLDYANEVDLTWWERAALKVLQTIRQGLTSDDPNSTSGRIRTHLWTDEDALAKLSTLKPVPNANLITVHFDTTIGDVLPWSFEPVVRNVKVVPGETALSFFRVTNHSDKPITGVATYNVHPPKLGLYFQKIQCFCFEEQRLLPGETVDMPVFYFIDPEMLQDPQVSYVTNVTLSYTFFQTDLEDDEEQED